MPKYPDITVKLVGTDGNAYSVLGKVCSALRKAGKPTDAFLMEATSGDYNDLLNTAMEYVNVE